MMNENKYKYPGPRLWRFQYLMALFSVVVLLTTACSKKEEPIRGRILKFSFDSTSQTDPDAIHEIEVFVFDAQLRLIGRTSIGMEGTVVLNYPQTPTLHCIAWGNSKDSSLELSQLQPGDPLYKGYLTLTPLSPAKAETTFCNTPPNLFRGALQIDNNTSPADQPSINMVMQPATASLHITISGLPETTGTDAGNYAIEVSRAATRIDFEGNTDGTASHHLTGSFNSKKEYIIPPFRLFPPTPNESEGEGIMIDILHDGKLLKSITQTSDGQPILPKAGKELTLLISFSPSGNVEIGSPGWNPTDIEVVYPK